MRPAPAPASAPRTRRALRLLLAHVDPSTSAPRGPWRRNATRTSTSSGAPSTCASTVPSGRLATQPATPRASARRRVDSRKKTPCTRPWTMTRRATGAVTAASGAGVRGRPRALRRRRRCEGAGAAGLSRTSVAISSRWPRTCALIAPTISDALSICVLAPVSCWLIAPDVLEGADRALDRVGAPRRRRCRRRRRGPSARGPGPASRRPAGRAGRRSGS